MFPILLLTIIPSIILSILIFPIIVKKTERMNMYDMPSGRKVHTTPVSRFGGMAFFPIMLVSVIFVLLTDNYLGYSTEGGIYGINNTWRMIVILLSGSVVYITGFFDDYYGLGYKIKFVTQSIASFFITMGLCMPIFGFTYQIFFVWFFIVFVINSVNLIDGIDGLSSGIACITLLVIIVCHVLLGNWFGAIVATALLGVIATYFYYNVYSWEYKLFMGDTGSMTIGLMLGYLIVSVHVFEQKSIGGFPYYLSICIAPLLIPMLDVIRVFFVRKKAGKNPFLADKNHIHHILMEQGLTPSQTLRTLLIATVIVTIFVCVILRIVL